jgi:hypothetical protein
VTLTAVAVGAAAINLSGMLLVPYDLGHLLLGHAWRVAQPLLLPTGIALVCAGLLSGPQCVLIGVRATQKAMLVNVVSIPILLAGTLVGAELDGVRGALWLGAAGWAVIAVIWWITYELYVHRAITSERGGIVLTPVTGAALRRAELTPVAAGGGIVLTPVTRTGPLT